MCTIGVTVRFDSAPQIDAAAMSNADETTERFARKTTSTGIRGTVPGPPER